MKPYRPLLMTLVTGVVCCFTIEAEAQFACPAASTEEQATRLAGETFDEGEQLFTEDSHRAAIERFECSYALRQHPNTLFNIARAAEELEDWPLARSTYRNLIRRFPESEAVAEAEERLQSVEGRIGQAGTRESEINNESPQEPETNNEAPQEPETNDEAPQESETRHEDPQESATTPEITPLEDLVSVALPQDESRAPMSRLRIGVRANFTLGLAMTITGAALYGAAFFIHYGMPANVEIGQVPGDYEKERDLGRACEASGWALFGTGLASLVVSIVLFKLLERQVSSANRSSSSTRLLLSPSGMYLAF